MITVSIGANTFECYADIKIQNLNGIPTTKKMVQLLYGQGIRTIESLITCSKTTIANISDKNLRNKVANIQNTLQERLIISYDKITKKTEKIIRSTHLTSLEKAVRLGISLFGDLLKSVQKIIRGKLGSIYKKESPAKIQSSTNIRYMRKFKRKLLLENCA